MIVAEVWTEQILKFEKLPNPDSKFLEQERSLSLKKWLRPPLLTILPNIQPSHRIVIISVEKRLWLYSSLIVTLLDSTRVTINNSRLESESFSQNL